MNNTTPSQIATIEAIAPDIDIMPRSIAVALALQAGSRSLIGALCEIGATGPRETITLRLDRTEGGLRLSPDGSVAPVHEIVGRSITLDQVRAEKPLLMTELTAAFQRHWLSAVSILSPLLEASRMPTRDEFSAVARWAPLLIARGYRLATRLIDVVDLLRNDALSCAPSPGVPHSDALTRYYGVLLCSAHLLLLTSPSGGRHRFADMTKTRTGANWTPTVSLVRERTLWLTAAAVRSAAALGPEAISVYDHALCRAEHPVAVFDALLGLVSIACCYERSIDEIVQRIEVAHAAVVDHNDQYLLFTDRAFRSAREALRAKLRGADRSLAVEAATGWQGGTSEAGFATAQALRLDSFDMAETGEMIGLLAIPTILRVSVATHYPAYVGDKAERLPAASDLAGILHRAWVARRDCSPGSATAIKDRG